MVRGHNDQAASTAAPQQQGTSSAPEAETHTQPGVAGRIGQRNTKQRRAVVDTMRDSSSFRTAAEIHRELSDRGEKVGLTTVYRTLQSLADIKAVDVLHQAGGEALYRLCSDGHHHHLVCTGCGTTVEVSGGPVEAWAQQLADEHGFTLSDHQAEVFGRCQSCQQLDN